MSFLRSHRDVAASGTVVVTRWMEWRIPGTMPLPPLCKIAVQKDQYHYEAPTDNNRVEWYLESTFID